MQRILGVFAKQKIVAGYSWLEVTLSNCSPAALREAGCTLNIALK
jgi:hypothetical protein